MPEHDSVLLTTLFVYKSDPERPQRFQALQSTSHPAPMFVVNPSQGISFLGDIALSFGDSAQDTISVLGDPSHVSLKTQDPLSIHSGVKLNAHQPDYFFNYYPLGVDILFDSSTHTIKKFILRTNLPSSAYFDLYRKCHFHIVPPPKKDAIKRINEGDKIVESDEEGDEAKYKAQVIDSDMKVRDLLLILPLTVISGRASVRFTAKTTRTRSSCRHRPTARLRVASTTRIVTSSLRSPKAAAWRP